MSTNKLPWFKFFTADFRDKTDHLSNAEVGAYIRLMISYWGSSGLPNDERKLKRIAQIQSAEDGDLCSILGEFFDVDENDVIRHRELDNLLVEAIGEQDANTRRTENARKARAAGRGSVTDNVTTSVTETDVDVDKDVRRKTADGNADETCETEIQRQTENENPDGNGNAHEDGNADRCDRNVPVNLGDSPLIDEPVNVAKGSQAEQGDSIDNQSTGVIPPPPVPQTPSPTDEAAELRRLEQLWSNTPQRTKEEKALRGQRRKDYLTFRNALNERHAQEQQAAA